MSGEGKKPEDSHGDTLPDWSEFDSIPDAPAHSEEIPHEENILSSPEVSSDLLDNSPITESSLEASIETSIDATPTAEVEPVFEAASDVMVEPPHAEAAHTETPQRDAYIEPHSDVLAETAPPPDLNDIKTFSEAQRPGKLAVPASYPFTVMIEGFLEPHSREVLLDLISSENLGIRSVDLEPGLDVGRVLIPRISEYAAVVIAQKLRDSSAKIKIEPSDSINENEGLNLSTSEFEARDFAPKLENHPAEKMPVTTQSSIPGMIQNQVVDTFVSHAHFSKEVDTSEIESLIRSMKYKAHRKGVKALVELKVQIEPEPSTAKNRVTITAVGIA